MVGVRIVCALVLLTSSGCAGSHGLKPGAATALVALGALVTTAGVLISAGCSNASSAGTGCGSDPTQPNLAAGLPTVAAGAALIAAGTLKTSKPGKKQAPLPEPVQPDPFVQPLRPLW